MTAITGVEIPGIHTFSGPGAMVAKGNLVVASPNIASQILTGNQLVNGSFSSSSFNINADRPCQFSPDMTWFNNTCFMAYQLEERGTTSSFINVIESQDGAIWASMAPVLDGHVDTPVPPSITTFNNRLMVVYTYNMDSMVYTISSADGRSWDAQATQLPSGTFIPKTDYAPAAVGVTVGGEEHLYVIYIQENLVAMIFADLVQAGPGLKVNNSYMLNLSHPLPTAGVAMTVLNNTLYVVYQTAAGTGNTLQCMTSPVAVTSGSWSGPFQVGDCSPLSNTRPAVTNDGKQVIVAYTGVNKRLYYLVSSDGSSWANPS